MLNNLIKIPKIVKDKVSSSTLVSDMKCRTIIRNDIFTLTAVLSNVSMQVNNCAAKHIHLQLFMPPSG